MDSTWTEDITISRELLSIPVFACSGSWCPIASFNNNGERTNNANNGERTNNANNGERTKNANDGERTALVTSAQVVIVNPAHSNNHRQWSQIVSESLQKWLKKSNNQGSRLPNSKTFKSRFFKIPKPFWLMRGFEASVKHVYSPLRDLSDTAKAENISKLSKKSRHWSLQG